MAIQLHFHSHSGEKHSVSTTVGSTLMEAAVSNGIAGIDAECGGACACATCHVYIPAGWSERLPPPSSSEADMLEFAHQAEPNSRLSCQITITEQLDGLTVILPESQK